MPIIDTGRGLSLRPDDYLTPEQRVILDKAFVEGKSLRAAAALAGVTKVTAFRFRHRNGGMDGYRKRGAIFKQNRWK
jgi:hypothetical protein